MALAPRLLYTGSSYQQMGYCPIPRRTPRTSTKSKLPLLKHCSFYTVAINRTDWHAVKLGGMRSTTLYSAADASQGVAHRTAPASFSCGEASAGEGSSTGACAGRKRRRRPFIGPKGGTHSSFGST